jgi:succinate dehydrogenase / fumarate reductase flavoprotein subunit
MKYHNAIVVGGGLAGMRAAIALNQKNISVALISKVHPLRSHSGEAQGGINAALCNHPRGYYDSPELHAFDTVKGSDYLADQPAVIKMTKMAPEIIYEMENWGCPFSRTEDGRIAQRPFGGAGFPRTCYAADKTGHVLLHTCYEQIIRFQHNSERNNLVTYDEWIVIRLVMDGETCAGVIALNIQTGEIEAFQADAVIFATGGLGRIYANTTNALISTGLSMAIPFWEGIPLKDMEFIQFHPTTLFGTNILMTEGCRGEGGYIVNSRGERFLSNYPDSAKAMEVAPRDIVSRNIRREIQKGNGFENAYVHLDMRHLGEQRICERLPGIRELAVNFAGVDPVKEPVPIQPGMHYSMGGIDTDENCSTALKGFYAAGECACVSVHGANRLGGNSLLETLVFGKTAGLFAADYINSKSAVKQGENVLGEALKQEKEKIKSMKEKSGNENPAIIKEELAATMRDMVGIFREEKELKKAFDRIKQLQERYHMIGLKYRGERCNYDLLWALELRGNLDVAEAVVLGALNRKESRGSQSRLDYPNRDDQNFLRHTIAKWNGKGVDIDYSPVKPGMWEPKERKY